MGRYIYRNSPNPLPPHTTMSVPAYEDLCPPRGSSGGWPIRDDLPPPPSGFRIPLPSADLIGPPVHDKVFVGSAIFDNSVHPCKIDFSLFPPCRVSFGGSEVCHYGRYELLPITSEMEWVPAKNGEIPPGRRPVEGGFESGGQKLYHALGKIDDVNVPGKTGEHLVSGSLTFTPLRLAFP